MIVGNLYRVNTKHATGSHFNANEIVKCIEANLGKDQDIYGRYVSVERPGEQWCVEYKELIPYPTPKPKTRFELINEN